MDNTAEDKREKALDLTEAALDALETGDESKADKLIAEAKKLDPSALQEVVQDLAEAERATDGHDHLELDDEDLEMEDDDDEDDEEDEDEEEE